MKTLKIKPVSYHYFGDKYVKRPKYGNRSCRCMLAHIHHSILEADYCNELLVLKNSGKIKSFEIQHFIPLKVNGKHITNHFVDFLVEYPEGSQEFHEVKGFEQEVWKMKRRLVEALYPDIPYIVKTEKKKYASFMSKVRANDSNRNW